MYLTKSLLTKIFLFLLIQTTISSCIKEEVSCGESLVITCPSSVDEGDDLVLTVEGLENTGIEGFLWECPDMQPYNMLTEGRVHTNSNSFTIQDFNIQDVGTYNVKMYPEGENCAAVILEKTVEMNPTICPCANPPLNNTLYYGSSYEGQFSEETMTASFYNSNTEESSTITFSGTNTLQIFFGRKLPEFSSTFNIAGGTYTFWPSDGDPYLDVQFHLDGYNHGFDYFGIEDMTEKMYVNRSGNILTMQFCDLQVHNYITNVFTLSGKFVILL